MNETNQGAPRLPVPHGRGSAIDPPNRFTSIHSVPDYADFENDPEFLEELRRVSTQFLDDNSKSIVSENDSPDVHFRYSVNAYRGCEHGCSYCYRPPKHATTPHLLNLYRTRASGRIRWQGNRPGSTSKSGLR